MKKKVFKAWAVTVKNSPEARRKGFEGHGEHFAGTGWFARLEEIPECVDGCRVVLFRTREQARQAIREKDSWFTTYTPRRVEVEVRVP